MKNALKKFPLSGPDISGKPVTRDYNRITTLLDYLGRALLSLGVPAFRVEAALSLFAERMNVSIEVMSTPTVMIATVRDDEDERTFIVRENPGPTDLGKLAGLADILNDLAADKVSVAGACQQASDVYHSPNRIGLIKTFVAFVIASASASLLLGGSWNELILAAQLGVVAAVFNYLSRMFQPMNRLHIPLASIVISFLAVAYCSWRPGVSYIEPIIAGLITLLPGLAITTATRELASGHMLAGATRMAGACVVLFAMVFGVGIGGTLADMLFQEPPLVTPTPVADWVMYVVAVLMGFALCLRFRAARQDWPAIIFTCVLTMGLMYLASDFSDPVMAAFSISVVIGLLGNLYAHFRHRPGTIIQLPGILLLVPGSLSLFSFASLMQSEIVTGLEELFRAILIAMAIATGLILSNVALPPRTDL